MPACRKRSAVASFCRRGRSPGGSTRFPQPATDMQSLNAAKVVRFAVTARGRTPRFILPTGRFAAASVTAAGPCGSSRSSETGAADACCCRNASPFSARRCQRPSRILDCGALPVRGGDSPTPSVSPASELSRRTRQGFGVPCARIGGSRERRIRHISRCSTTAAAIALRRS